MAHESAGNIGGMLFLVEFAKLNDVTPLATTQFHLDSITIRTQEHFNYVWVKDRKLDQERMNNRFNCDVAVGFNFMRDKYNLKWPNSGMPGEMSAYDAKGKVLECETGEKALKNITRDLKEKI